MQGIFKAAFANGPGGARGPGGAGGPPPGGGPGGPPPSDEALSTSTSVEDILKQFLETLQEQMSASSSSAYSATGTASGGKSVSFSALLIDYQS